MKWYPLPASLFLAAFFSQVTKVRSGTSVGLMNSVYSVGEGDGFVEVCVAMERPGIPNLTVMLRTISDYGEVERLVSTPDCVSIPIVNDNCMEEVERFNVSLEMVDGEGNDIMFGTSSATVYITDDQDPYVVPFLSGIKWSHHCLDGSLVADVGFDSTVYEVLKGEDLEFCIQTLCGDSLSILAPLRRKPVFIAILKELNMAQRRLLEYNGTKQCTSISIPADEYPVGPQMMFNLTLSALYLPGTIGLSRNVSLVTSKTERLSLSEKVMEWQGCASMDSNADEDYHVIEEEFTIQTGGGEGCRICVNISIKNDSILEDEEEFTVSLKLGETHTFTFNTSPATIRISDDDFCDAGRGDRAVVSLQKRLYRPSKNKESIEVCASLRIQTTDNKCNCPSPFNHFFIRAYTVRREDNSYVESPNPLEMTFHNCKPTVCVTVPITPELRAINKPFFVFLLRPYRQDRRISINKGRQAAQVNI
ncbi:hypothetical protein GBAR_LOCUS555 [Geodia barretti]|uniref:Calx-beta domain-containing protein n=1 Tax=Geodia barretti TaxID=519541 RepID=A0AA35QTT3_GEOBA|nr:hypothetical protein GBAR_LOCUS555 [Geodia barretti]